MRLIIDARRSNLHFNPPPNVELLTAEGLSKIEVELPAELEVDSEAVMAEGEKAVACTCHGCHR